MITTGVNGRPWRGEITPWGAVRELPDGAPLEWYVAADDRWHIPSRESAVRQQRVEGTPVTETRVRVPQGDVVQRVYSCADRGGITVVEVENESPMAVAVAFSHRQLLSERPIADVPIDGIALPASACVFPLGHRAVLRVGVAHRSPFEGTLPRNLPSALQVMRGWRVLTERAGRITLPPGEIGDAALARATADRCELVLRGPAPAKDDPAALVLGLHELVRMGESPKGWLPDLASAVERLARQEGWTADVALTAAARVLAMAGERRAGRDLERIRNGREPSGRPSVAPDGLAAIAWLESLLVDGAQLLPRGFPDAWLGQPIEVHGLPTGPESEVSFAIRWHGARPAVLWEQTGTPLRLRSPVVAPGWATTERVGEALWPAPGLPPG